MLCHVIACGDSASKWDGSGDNIGVNDAFKWGHQLQRLVLLNSPQEFEADRLATIKRTQCEAVYSCYREWTKPMYSVNNLIYFDYHVWQGHIAPKNHFQTSRTSPFCAISIAYNLGYDEIVLWGVDFKTHKIWHSGNTGFVNELRNYNQLIEQLKNRGIMVYSSEPSILKLPVYEVYEKKKMEQERI